MAKSFTREERRGARKGNGRGTTGARREAERLASHGIEVATSGARK